MSRAFHASRIPVRPAVIEYTVSASPTASVILGAAAWKRRFGITGGNIFDGEMSLDQMFALRPEAAG